MTDILQTKLGFAVQDNTDIRGPATYVEVGGRHFVVNHYTTDPIGSSQYPDGLRVYEVTGNSTSGFSMTNVDETAYSTAGSGLGVDFARGATDKMQVFEKDGTTYLAQNTTEKYIFWEMSSTGQISHVETINKPAAIDGDVRAETPDIHVADDGSITIIQGGYDRSMGSADPNQATDNSIWVTTVDDNFDNPNSYELVHSIESTADDRATTGTHAVDIGNNEKLIYATGDWADVPVWKVAADGTITEQPSLSFGGTNNSALGSATPGRIDSIYNPVDKKHYMMVTRNEAHARNATLYEIDPATGGSTRLTHGSGAANSNSRLYHDVDGDGDGNHDDGNFRDLSAIDSIEMGVDPVTGEMFFTAHSRWAAPASNSSDNPYNHPSNGLFNEGHNTRGGVATYGITNSGGTWSVDIIEGTLAANTSGMMDSATTFDINGETVTVGFDAWGTSGSQPFGGRSLWIHEASFETEMPVCFVKGTRIMTPTGEVAIENLSVGDLVTTAQGAKPIRWIGTTVRRAKGKLAPIRISAGSLGDDLPKRDLLVSRQHRMVVKSELAQDKANKKPVLLAAIKLTVLPGVEEVMDMASVTYIHLLFDTHQIVFAESAPSESLYLGEEAKKSLGPAALEEIRELFPDLQRLNCPKPALPIPENKVQKRIARALM